MSWAWRILSWTAIVTQFVQNATAEKNSSDAGSTSAGSAGSAMNTSWHHNGVGSGVSSSWGGTVSTSWRFKDKCLPNGWNASDRKWLTTTADVLPIGVWNMLRESDEVDAATAIFMILVQDVLGYNAEVVLEDVGSSAPRDALYALSGCEWIWDNQSTEGTNALQDDWKCLDQVTHVHVVLGITLETQGLQRHFDFLQRERIGGLLEDLGSLGYQIRSGIYVKGSTAAKASLDRVFLDDYRTYNASQQFLPMSNLQQYFSEISEITTESGTKLIPCDEWKFADTELDLFVLSAVDADLGLSMVNGQIVVQCSSFHGSRGSNYWWRFGPCKQNTSRCIPFITQRSNGLANKAFALMYTAFQLNWPIALGLADGYWIGSDFQELVSMYDVLYFYWKPAVTFYEENAVMVLPMGDGTSVEPRTVVSTDLQRLAPDVRLLLSNMRFSLEDIHEMMSYGSQPIGPKINPSEGDLENATVTALVASPSQWISGDVFDGACHWIQSNPTRWIEWIPARASCLPGQGLYQASSSEWLNDIEAADASIECRACPPGRFSFQISDTAICRPCDVGQIQPSYSSEACQQCPPGSFAGSGESSCTKCPQGEYQDLSGASSCKKCAPGQTTLQGSRDIKDCVCEAGTVAAIANSTGNLRTTNGSIDAATKCLNCSAGLLCENDVALQLKGFWAVWGESSDSLSVFQCRDALQCPGVAVGTCATGREGRACGSCIAGFAAQFDGTCAKCGGQSLWPIIVMLLVVVGALPLALAAGIFMTRARRAALSIFMVSIIFGQVVVCLQALDAIYQMDITWLDPAKAILQSLAIFSFDLDFSCVLPPQDFVLEYAVQLTAYPVVVLVTLLIWLSMRWSRTPVSFTAFVNVHGLLLVALLTAMTLAIVRPLQCRNNPNRLFTIASRPNIICWKSQEHQTLVVLAAAGLVAYPVTILAAITYLTRKYPIWLRSGGGIEVMERYRFLFARFRPERYYYGLILCTHNLTVGIIPAALVSFPALQVGIMGIVICLKLIVQILLWPWRLDIANYNDLALSAGLLILLLLASPLLNIDQAETLTFVAILVSIVMIVLPVVAMFAALAVVMARLRPQSKYAAFLCHHKAGAGALCRFFKLVAKKYVKMNIFLDSDELDDLARIFDVVRADTKCLVVVLTAELLNRMWCALEIASAHKHQVPIIPLYCDDYAFPDLDSIDVIESVWTEEQRSTLISFGTSMDDIKAAYKHVRKLKSFALCRSWPLEEQEEKILQIIAESSCCSPGLLGQKLPSSAGSGGARISRILVCALQVPEAVSTGLILQQMVQLYLRRSTYSLRSVEDVYAATKASCVLVLLTKGVLSDAFFARCLLACRQSAIEFVPVNDGSFQFPLPEFITEVENGMHEAFSNVSPNMGPLLAKTYQALLSILALPLTPHGSSGILERQVSQICQRFRSLEPRRKALNEMDPVDSRVFAEVSAEVAPRSNTSKKEECQGHSEAGSINSDDLWHT